MLSPWDPIFPLVRQLDRGWRVEHDIRGPSDIMDRERMI